MNASTKPQLHSQDLPGENKPSAGSRNSVLNTRPTQPQDFSECFGLIEERAYYTPAEQPRLLSFWRYLLKGRMTHSIVVEDVESPLGQRLLFFGMTTFVTDEFIREVRTMLPPPLSHRLFERWLKGRRCFLNRKEIARGNSGEGLNLVLLHTGWKQGLPDDVKLSVDFRVMDAFFRVHSGFQIKEYLRDIFTEGHRMVLQNHDARLRREYAGPFPSLPDGSLWPLCLMGVKRDEGTRPTGRASLLNLFHGSRPRFGFTQGEKDVLEKALEGETDQAISKSLRLTLWAIKKRWQGVYEKVEKLHARLLMPKSSRLTDRPESSKVERRRYFLEYLREHLEEIRPTLSLPRKKAALGPGKKAPVA